jgi:hypothetical protein
VLSPVTPVLSRADAQRQPWASCHLKVRLIEGLIFASAHSLLHGTVRRRLGDLVLVEQIDVLLHLLAVEYFERMVDANNGNRGVLGIDVSVLRRLL